MKVLKLSNLPFMFLDLETVDLLRKFFLLIFPKWTTVYLEDENFIEWEAYDGRRSVRSMHTSGRFAVAVACDVWYWQTFVRSCALQAKLYTALLFAGSWLPNTNVD